MKKILTLLVIGIVGLTGCRKFDDSALWNSIGDLDKRVERLEELCAKMNTNISSLQAIVHALESHDYIENVVSLPNGDGYIISFASGKDITIYHGEDGKDGTDGDTPIISIKQDTDGVYYWTVNGEWLLVEGKKVKATGENGNNGSDGADGVTPKFKIENGYWYISYDNGISWEQLGKATGEDGSNGQDGVSPEFKIDNGYWYVSYDKGKTWTQIGQATGNNGQDGADGADGITPQFKIEDGYWYVSYDNKMTWEQVGQATGENGQDGDSIFEDVSQDDSNVYFTLVGGDIITIPKGHNNDAMVFNYNNNVNCIPGYSVKIPYELLNAGSNSSITCIPSQDWAVEITRDSNTTGNIIVTSPKTFEKKEIILLISNDVTTIVKTITINKGEINIGKHVYVYSKGSGSDVISIDSNTDYYIRLDQELDWISDFCTDADKSEISFSYAESNDEVMRDATIYITDCKGVTYDKIYLCQDSYKTIVLDINGVELKMVYVKGGSFNGVTLKDYYISETEVTEDLYSAVMTGKGNGSLDAQTGFSPKEWSDFFLKISEYELQSAAGNYWFYAAKGGAYSKGYVYAGSNNKSEVAATNIGEVKRCKPNELGLYDMSGNLGEWGYNNQGWYYQFGGYGSKVESLDKYLEYYNKRVWPDMYSEAYVSDRSGYRLMRFIN